MNKLSFIITFLVAGMVTPAVQLSAQTFYHTGNEEPVETNHLPGLVLAGGAGDNDDAMQWMLERADGGDVVVLRASGSDGYNNYFYSDLGVSVNSVTSIVIESADHANSEEVVEIVNNAEVVFIAGGNQWNYVNYWRDSALLEALQQLITEKQITIGGTSAGMAVLGEVVFTAENQTVYSSEALANPYHWRVKLEKDFLHTPFMQNTVTDSHYNRPENDGNDRKGRHVAFMARMVSDWHMPAKGIAANEYTAIAVDETGKARVFGHPSYPDYGYFLKKYGGPPEICEDGLPLTWNQAENAIKVYKVKGDFDGSGWFDLDSWEEGQGGVWQYWYVDDGALFEVDADDDDNTGILFPDHDGLRVVIFPNPATDIIHVSIGGDWLTGEGGVFSLRMLTADGRLVQHVGGVSGRTAGFFPGSDINGDFSSNVFSIQTSHLPAGVYLLELSNGHRQVARVFVKQ